MSDQTIVEGEGRRKEREGRPRRREEGEGKREEGEGGKREEMKAGELTGGEEGRGRRRKRS